MFLAVVTDAIRTASTELAAVHSNLSQLLNDQLNRVNVQPPGKSDPFSPIAAKSVNGYVHGSFKPVAQPGVQQLADGAQVLVPVANGYQNTDTNNAGGVQTATDVNTGVMTV